MRGCARRLGAHGGAGDRGVVLIGEDGEAEGLRLAEVRGDEFRQVGVQVAIGHRLRPLLGLEAYVARGPSEFPAWQRTFAALADEGACDPAKTRALLDWWGHTTVSLPGAPWRVAIHRQFYVKVIVEGDRLQAKGYLANFPRYTLM